MSSAPRLRLLRYEPEPGEPLVDSPVSSIPPPTPVRLPPPDPTARLACAHVLRIVIEALIGRRPVAQLHPYLGASALRYVRAMAHGPQRPRGPARLIRIRLDEPGPGTAEVAAVIRDGARCRALAARFERTGPASDHWRCVALRLG